MVERSLSMREAWGSIPHFSNFLPIFVNLRVLLAYFMKGKLRAISGGDLIYPVSSV